MTEQEAQDWLAARGWWTGVKGDRLRRFVALLLDEADRQNLISQASRAEIWARHIVDSAQLPRLAPVADGAEGAWVDLGTGAGLPGIVVACLIDSPVDLVEARPLRTAFLERCIAELGLDHARVHTARVERWTPERPARIISARAFAPLDRMLAVAGHLSDENTVWLLPKGRQAEKELEMLRRDWQALFHVEHSLTDPESSIVTIQQLRRRKPVSLRPNAGPRTKRRTR